MTTTELTPRHRALLFEALTTVDVDTLNDNLVAAGHHDTTGEELDRLAAHVTAVGDPAAGVLAKVGRLGEWLDREIDLARNRAQRCAAAHSLDEYTKATSRAAALAEVRDHLVS